MFVEKVAYIVQVELPEGFDKLDYNQYYENYTDGAYYEIEVKGRPAQIELLQELKVLNKEEYDKVLAEEIAYIMIWVP